MCTRYITLHRNMPNKDGVLNFKHFKIENNSLSVFSQGEYHTSPDRVIHEVIIERLRGMLDSKST